MNITDKQILSLLAKQKKDARSSYKSQWNKDHRVSINEQRKQYRAENAREIRSREKQKELSKPFIGVDGEGAGEGLSHIYWLIRVGNIALFHEDGSELGSIEILRWLADLGAAGINEKFIPVSFFFDYDTSMILRHLPEKNLRELMYDGSVCQRRTCQHHKNMHVKGYNQCGAISSPGVACSCTSYLRGGETTVFTGKKHTDFIKVRLQHRQFKVAWGGKPYFTITDVGDLFQTSFLKVLEKWQHVEGEDDLLTDEQLEVIRVNKERRSNFKIGFDINTFDYNALECELLAELMRRFRNMCYSNGIFPDMWTGPGRLAEDVFKSESVPMRVALNIPPVIERLGDYAYFGGRMEGIHFGSHENIVAYDIASAYPHAYTMLPCLLQDHGKWEEVSFEEVQKDNLQNTLIVGQFSVLDSPFDAHPRICGLPMRDKRGAITFPTDAHGVWWYPEVRETIKLYEVENVRYSKRVDKCFTWRQSCTCTPGAFTSKWFQIRLQVGKSTRGIPVKLMLNSLYGKSAQRVGAAKWANTVWAGLLTSITRARLLEATQIVSSENIISYQTDGIFVKSRSSSQTSLPVTQGNGEPETQALNVPGLPGALAPGATARLGEWETELYKELFLIQSGVYSAEDYEGKRVNKTRGMRDFEFRAAYDDIKAAWESDRWYGSFELPKRNTFVTIKLGIQWGYPHLIGCWLQQKRTIRFSSNIDKREIWETRAWETRGPIIAEETKDGSTFAPGQLHSVMIKREYGPHALNPEIKAAGGHEMFGFSYPYSRELAAELAKESREEETSYSYITPDEPYSLGE